MHSKAYLDNLALYYKFCNFLLVKCFVNFMLHLVLDFLLEQKTFD